MKKDSKKIIKKTNDKKGTADKSNYNKIDLKLCERLAGLSFTSKEFYKALGISKATMYKYMDAHPEFKTIVDKAKFNRISEVAMSMYKKANGIEQEEEVYERLITGYNKINMSAPGRVPKYKLVPIYDTKLTLVKKTKKQLAPDTLAGMYLLNNVAPSLFKRNTDVIVPEGEKDKPKVLEVRFV